MSARELLAAATPRPWTTADTGNRYGSVASADKAAIAAFCDRWPDHGRQDVEAYGGALVGESIQPADRHLIVAAVNEYEPLLSVEQRARELLRGPRSPIAVAQLHEALDALDRTRIT